MGRLPPFRNQLQTTPTRCTSPMLKDRVGSTPADPHPAPERPLTVRSLDLSNFAVCPDWGRWRTASHLTHGRFSRAVNSDTPPRSTGGGSVKSRSTPRNNSLILFKIFRIIGAILESSGQTSSVLVRSRPPRNTANRKALRILKPSCAITDSFCYC